MSFHISFRDERDMKMRFREDPAFSAKFGEVQYVPVSERYEGEYIIEPTQHEQILPTAEKLLAENITVKAIPKNYGLITWNGAVLTVS